MNEYETLEVYTEADYTEQLEEISQQLDDVTYQLEQINEGISVNNNQQAEYFPVFYEGLYLLLGTVIVITVYKAIMSFLGRFFSDR